MCTIIVKPAGQKLPKDDLMELLWSVNPHGGGFCWADGGVVHGMKGFMDEGGFIKAIRKYLSRNVPAIIHFRWATHGGRVPEATHPFPASSDESDLKKTEWESAFGIAHNGTIHRYGYKTTGSLSDTQDYIKSVLSNELVLEGIFSDKHRPTFVEMIDSAISGDRLALMNGDGEIIMIGDWHDHDGLSFSNECFKYAKAKEKIVSRSPAKTTTCSRGGMVGRSLIHTPQDDLSDDLIVASIMDESKIIMVDETYNDKCLNCGTPGVEKFKYNGKDCCCACFESVLCKEKAHNSVFDDAICAIDLVSPISDSQKIALEMLSYGYMICPVVKCWVDIGYTCGGCKLFDGEQRDDSACTCKGFTDFSISRELDLPTIDESVYYPVVSCFTLEEMGAPNLMVGGVESLPPGKSDGGSKADKEPTK